MKGKARNDVRRLHPNQGAAAGAVPWVSGFAAVAK